MGKKILDSIPKGLRVVLFGGVLLWFFVSIEAMGVSFKLFGKEFAEGLLSTTSNPWVGLVIGILATSLVQSSSFTTSMVVGLVGCGVLTVPNAIPIILGANIGTSVTNALVSLGHITKKSEFRRAFAGATVHDFFNLLSVGLLLPIELATGFLQRSAHYLETAFEGAGGLKFGSPLKMIVQPIVKGIVHQLQSAVDGTDATIGIILLVLALASLFLSLKFLVDLMKSLLLGRIENLMNKVLFENALIAFLLGMVLTAIIQSSSITTSLAVPLVGAGILTVRKIFPYTVGANIGTTITAILASMVTKNPAAITVAFSHLIFNIVGSVLFLLIPATLKATVNSSFIKRFKLINAWLINFRQSKTGRIIAKVIDGPITLATGLGEIASKRRYIAILFIVGTFYGLPILLVLLTRILGS